MMNFEIFSVTFFINMQFQLKRIFLLNFRLPKILLFILSLLHFKISSKKIKNFYSPILIKVPFILALKKEK